VDVKRSLPRYAPWLAAPLVAYLLLRGFGLLGGLARDTLPAYLFEGLSLGAVYAFIALGYTMVYGIIRLINFAHGEFFMAGAFAGYFVLRDAGIDRLALPQPWPVVACFLAALLAGALVAGVLAVLAEALCYRPIRRAGRIAALLTAVGLSLFLQNVARQWPLIGPTQRPWPDPRMWVAAADVPTPADARYYEIRTIKTSSGKVFEREKALVEEGDEMSEADRSRLVAAGATVYRKFVIQPNQAKGGVVLMLVISTALLWFLVQRTRTGKAMRAVSEDLPAAQLMGVPVNRVIAATFFLGAVIAGAGGVAYCTTYGQVDPLTGFMPGLKAFVAAVLGGIGSIPGAVVGGLFLGTIETLFGAYVSTEWKDALAFAVLILVLLWRPTGLLGRERREKV
jgi:branched-chain amino acid transport system permease protein